MPMPAAASATARAARCTSDESATSRWRVIAPITISLPSRRIPVSSAMPARSTRPSGEASRSRIIGTSDWPPAIGFAPSRMAASASSSEVARV